MISHPDAYVCMSGKAYLWQGIPQEVLVVAQVTVLPLVVHFREENHRQPAHASGGVHNVAVLCVLLASL